MAITMFRKGRRGRRGQVGAPPGTIVVDPEAAPTVVRVIAYSPDDLVERQVDDLSALAELPGKWPVVWVNVDGLGDAELMARIGERFDVHRLVLEDVVNVHQRAKVEQYGRRLFVVSRMCALNERLETEQISLLLQDGVVITFQERVGDCLDPVRERIRNRRGRIRERGADYLAYAILDAVIDNYFPVLEEFGERLEQLEDDVIDRPTPQSVTRIHAAKRELLALRRAIWPQREAMNWLVREPFETITDDTRLYLRDCYDHVSQIIDMVETYRELASGLLDAYQSSLANRMNEVMKVLTIIATIFIPLSFVAGVYGMNFDPERSPLNMPELKWTFGYPFALALMALLAGGMLLFFRRKGWLGSSAAKGRRNGGSDADEQ